MTSIQKKFKESEERFKSLFKGGPIPTFAWQKEGKSFKLIDFNNAAENFTQGNVGKFLGFTASEMYKERTDILNDLNRCFDERSNIIREMKYSFSTSEEEKNLLVTYSFIPPDSVLVHTEDVTDRKIAERKLRDSEEISHTLAEGLSQTGIGINIIGSNYNIIYQNQFLKEKFGVNQKRKCFVFYMGQEKCCEGCPMIKAIQNKKVEKAIITAANNRTYEIISAPLPNPNGSIERATEVLLDITERIESEQKLKESEEKYRSIFNNMTEGFAYHEVIVDEVNNPIDYKYLEVNPAFEKLTGLKADQMLGKKVTEILLGTENDPADWISKFGKVGLTGIPLVVEDYSEALDHWYKVSGYSPKKGFFAVTFSDITEQKKAEIKIAESGEKYRNLFNNAPFAIILFNIEGIILDCNDASNLITGYSNQDLIGKNFRDFNFYVDIKSANIEKREDKIKEGKIPKTREVLLQKKDGSQFWARTNIEFVQMKDKTYIQAIIHDVNEEKLTQIKLNESEQRLKERVKELNCLYEFSKVAEKPNITLKEIILESLNLIQSAWQFPKITCVRILFEDKEYSTNNFKESKWLLTTHVDINNKPMDIEVYYFEDKPFLNEEKDLLIDFGLRIKDILEKKESEAVLELEKKFVDDILNSSMDTVFVFNPESGRAIRWNNVFRQFSGYSDEEIASMKVPDSYYNEEDLKRASEATKKVLKEGKIKFEMSLITKDGRFIPYEYMATTLKSSYGDPLIVAVGRDISERKIAEEALKHSEKRYKEAYNRGNFYKDLFAHDMNNILQVVNSSAELITYQLGESEKSKEIESISEIIKKQVSRGSKLISNVRTLSELEEKEIITRKVDIGSFLRNSIIFVENAYEERNVNISVSSIDGEYFTNANELLQDVFENVLINSIRYNENSNIEISIRISKQEIDEKDYFKIEFIDNGIGVAKHRKEVIFKSGNRELKGSKGMGLGLSLVNKILQIFNGKIWVEDKVKGDYNKGSNFIIILPEVK